MEECFLSNKVTLIKPSGGNFTPRETDVISCIINGGTEKSIGRLLGISHHTAGNYIGGIRGLLGFGPKEKIIKFVEKSGKYRQINERYIDLLLFNEFEETLKKITSLEKTSQKYKCVIHMDTEDVSKCILLDYLKLAGIEIDISYDSKKYADDKFHIICCSENSQINLENLNADNIVVSENHCNDVINLTGKCIESSGTGAQYKAYFSLLGCISKIYSSKNIDEILNEFKEYYHNMKDGISSTNPERNQIEITDKRKTGYVVLSFIILLIASATMHWYAHWSDVINKTVLTNISMLIGQDIFLKRKDLISKMDQILDKQEGVKFLVLVGQGGAGKTTLARHYVHTNDTKVKWEINSATEESTIKSFLELAIELSKGNQGKKDDLKYVQAIEDPETQKKSIVSFVFSQLNKLGSWCLLFDNVDDFKMIYGFIPSNKDLCGEGKTIITTRNANCENVSFISDKSVLNIEYLGENEKRELFCSILYKEKCALSKDKMEELNKFLENIPSMPLDVSNAAYYIKNTNSSFEKYLEIVQSPNEETDELHSKFLNAGIEYNKTRYKMTLAAFDELIGTNPNFKELILFVCLLDSKNIPRKYLDQCKGSAIVHDFLHNLKRFFSISLDDGKFFIHKSIQEIGLMHLNALLTNDEKEAFFKKIIDIMTPYSSIFWEKYKTYPYKMKKKDLDELEVHIKSIIKNLKLLGISEKNKYITKLLLAIGFIYGEENVLQSKHFLNEALKHKKNNRYIEDYEYAIALLTLGFSHLYLDEFDDAKLWLNKGLAFCSALKDAEILMAYGLCDLGKYYAKTNEFSRAITLLEKALSIVDDNHESWARNTASQICWGLSHAYADHYINKPDGNKAIIYAQKSFKKLGLESYSYNKTDDIKKPVDSLGGSYWCLAKAYNRVGEHENAQKFEHYYYQMHEKYFKNDEHILDKALIDIEYGYTLLRKGELTSALNVLSEVITAKQELNDNYYLFHALVSRTEALIRLNRLDEAYVDFKYAIRQKGNSADNYTRLLVCISFYHAFIIKYKQRDYKLAFEHFSEFCSSIKEFCKGFLNKSEYNSLLYANAFEITKDKSQIKTCLRNSSEIFSSIYGKDHPFVKEYIIENSN